MVKTEKRCIYKMIEEKNVYTCEICGVTYTTQAEAEQCENKECVPSTKLLLGTIVKYEYEEYSGDCRPRFQKRVGIVIGYSMWKHNFRNEVMDLYDFWVSPRDKNELEIPPADEADKIFNNAKQELAEGIDLLESARNGTKTTKEILDIINKDREFYGRD